MVEKNPQGPERRAYFNVQREVRPVPLDWNHPKDERGEYIPLQRRDLSYTEEEIEEGLAEGWLKSRQEAENMLMPDFLAYPKIRWEFALMRL